MASALTVLFLGCCLAGRSGVSGEGSYPKPSISVSPGGVIPMGGNVTIRCWHQGRGMRFLLYKDGYWMHPTHMDPAGSEAEFPIPSARREHGGSYTCHYSYTTGPTAYSEPSDPVQIIVADPSLPRPSISLSPTGDTAPGANVTIQCRGQRWDVSFFLHRAGDLNPPRHMDPAGNGAEFHIPTVGRQHGGSYSCSYRPPSEPFVSSQPSDPVQLVVADPSLPRPSISLSPTGDTAPGANVTIRCQGQLRDVRFFLHKAGDLNPPRHMDPAGIGAEFHIPTVGRQHGGSYSCSYRPRSEPFVSSQPSDLVQLVVADPRLPRPSISLSPTRDTAPGANVTIRCRGQRRDVRFFLHKAGDRDLPRHMDPAGDGAEFHIPTVGRQHGGSYSCSYRPRSEPFVSSQPSHPVELVVAELLTWPIITGASAAAAVLLLLLLVAFVCFRKTRARKGAAPRPSSTCPMGALKASAQQDPVYASINEGKEPQTLEPDPGADRVTYAELDGQALQAKRGALAPAPEPAQPSMYAAINVSQGALQ